MPPDADRMELWVIARTLSPGDIAPTGGPPDDRALIAARRAAARGERPPVVATPIDAGALDSLMHVGQHVGGDR